MHQIRAKTETRQGGFQNVGVRRGSDPRSCRLGLNLESVDCFRFRNSKVDIVQTVYKTVLFEGVDLEPVLGPVSPGNKLIFQIDCNPGIGLGCG